MGRTRTGGSVGASRRRSSVGLRGSYAMQAAEKNTRRDSEFIPIPGAPFFWFYSVAFSAFLMAA